MRRIPWRMGNLQGRETEGYVCQGLDSAGMGTFWEEGCQGAKNFRVKVAQARVVQGWVISWVGRRGSLFQLITDFG